MERFSRVIALSIGASADGALPTEFRIFKAGVNEFSKGTFIFDEQAARDVMAAYTRDGVDLMIDLEHASIDQDAFANRADASDARGWFQPQIRNGELWAVNVTWTPDGARRLNEKTQRYISPVFTASKDDCRIKRVLNCAICAMPATYQAPPLVAATRARRDALARIRTFATSRNMRIAAGMAKVKTR